MSITRSDYPQPEMFPSVRRDVSLAQAALDAGHRLTDWQFAALIWSQIGLPTCPWGCAGKGERFIIPEENAAEAGPGIPYRYYPRALYFHPALLCRPGESWHIGSSGQVVQWARACLGEEWLRIVEDALAQCDHTETGSRSEHPRPASMEAATLVKRVAAESGMEPHVTGRLIAGFLEGLGGNEK